MFSPVQVGDFAKAIAQRLNELQNPDSESTTRDDCYVEQGNMFVCMPCEQFSTSLDIPSNLRKYCKGDLGKFYKPDSDNSQTNKDRRKRISNHTQNSLHLWCVSKSEETHKSEDLKKEKNRRGCDLILKNVVFR